MDIYETLKGLYDGVPEDDSTGMRERVEAITQAVKDMQSSRDQLTSERDAAIEAAQEAENKYRERFFQPPESSQHEVQVERRTAYDEFMSAKMKDAEKYKDITFNDIIRRKQ